MTNEPHPTIHAPKNIVLFFDGTWNGPPDPDRGTSATNVYKLYMMSLDDGERQITRYWPGVGSKMSERVRGGWLGFGMATRMVNAYRFLYENYNENDRVFIFGFSRGAAIARALATLLHRRLVVRHPLLDTNPAALADRAYASYRRDPRTNHPEEFWASLEPTTVHHDFRIRFLGVWDTVGAIGEPVRLFYKRDAGPIRSVIIGFEAIVKTLAKAAYRGLTHLPATHARFHDFSLSPCVENACHALAIDDRRKAFHPIVFEPCGDRLHQVWFAGVHADVGGGYSDHGLSDIPLVWLTHQAVLQGLLLTPSTDVVIAENYEGVMHDSLGRYKEAQRSWSYAETPVVHKSVVLRAGSPNIEGGYDPWILHHDLQPAVDEWTKLADTSWGAAFGAPG